MTRNKKILTVLKVAVLFAIIVGLPLLIYFRHPELVQLVMNRELLTETLNDNMLTGSLIFIGLQILQIVISIIPGQIIQFAGGYVFSIPMALLLIVVGCLLGEFLAFKLANFLGRDFVYMLAGEEKAQKFIDTMNSKKAFVAVLLIYLLPGLPKDVFTYVAGFSKLKAIPFVCISTIARLPAMFGSLLMGSFVYTKNTTGLRVVVAIAAVVLLVAFIYRKKLNALLDKLYVTRYAHEE
jgi:uncharacterized membrane protein YdjX (TVP38/TMEM64 family)